MVKTILQKIPSYFSNQPKFAICGLMFANLCIVNRPDFNITHPE